MLAFKHGNCNLPDHCHPGFLYCGLRFELGMPNLFPHIGSGSVDLRRRPVDSDSVVHRKSDWWGGDAFASVTALDGWRFNLNRVFQVQINCDRCDRNRGLHFRFFYASRKPFGIGCGGVLGHERI